MLDKLYFRIFDYVMTSVREGRLKLDMPDRRERLYGDASAAPLTVRVFDYAFFKRVIRGAGIGLGESYTEGLWETKDLTGFIEFLIRNKKYFDERIKIFKGVEHFLSAVRHKLRSNTLQNSVKNIQEHYDLSNDFFALFLDPSMTYSCANFDAQNNLLELAQANKIRRLAQSIDIKKADHVLEIGCGWGAFAIQTVRETGCRWTGLTLSLEQKKWAEQKVAEAGLTEQIEILLQDYRSIEGRFDKIVSVEMIEAVGHDFLSVYFDRCGELLKPGGLMALQAITIPEERYDNYRKNCDWIQKHIFPGGHLPSLELIQELASHAHLKAQSKISIGQDYAKTLAIWHETLLKNKKQLLEKKFDQSFLRKWQYYFSYCEAGFRAGFIDAYQIVLAK